MKRTPAIENFLKSKRIAFVGLSRDPADFSRMVYKELVTRGYEVIPVRPDAAKLNGARTFPRVQDISPPAEAALIMTPPVATESVVRDCIQAGVKKVWLHRGVGAGSATENAIQLCKDNGIEFVAGECPMMFMSDAAIFHKIHGFFRHGLTGPRATA